MIIVGHSGLFVVWRGVEYRLLVAEDGTSRLLAGRVPRPGPEWQGDGWWFLPVTEGDVEQVVRITFKGVYKGVPVEANAVDESSVLLTTSHVRDGVRVGMQQKEMLVAELIVPRDDPGLSVREEREVVPFPR